MRKFKPINTMNKGEVKATLEHDLKPEVISYQEPEDKPIEAGQTYADRMAKIVEKSKLKDEYEEMISDLTQVRNSMNVTRQSFSESAKTIDEGLQTFNRTRDVMATAVKSMSTICDRLIEIISRVEKVTYVIELDDKSKEVLDGFRKDILEKEEKLLKRHVSDMDGCIERHHDWVNNKIKSTKGFWFSTRNGYIILPLAFMGAVLTLTMLVLKVYVLVTGNHIFI